MKKLAKTIAVAVIAVLLLTTSAIPTAYAATEAQTQQIELTTRSILLVDKSGSMKNQDAVEEILSKLDTTSYDVVGYFDDSQISLEPAYPGGGNSAICETIDQIAKSGFDHISIVTDAEQWPQDYTALGIYSDLDITIHLVESSKEADEFVNQLKGRLTNSSLKVVTPEGEEQVLNGYKAPIYTIELPAPAPGDGDSNNSSDSTSTIISEDGENEEHGKKHRCLWWVALLLGILIAAVFDFIHELIANGKKEEKDSNSTNGSTGGYTPRPMPTLAVERIANGARVLADFSGSMKNQQAETAKACQEAGSGAKVLCFGERVRERKVSELSNLQAEGGTYGWEALKKASRKGWKEIVLVSDLGFNGEEFDESSFSRKFKKVTVVTPSNYDHETLENIRKIADEVEVLPLR